ncbi:MAG: hypothetical protein V4682_03645 [Patescibacteria group bacterium]
MYTVTGHELERELLFKGRGFSTFGHVVSAISALLDRKARGNGVTRHLASTLKYTGACTYTYPRRHPGNLLGFTCTIVPNEQTYRLWIAGSSSDTEMLVTRLNARESLCIAIRKSQEQAARTRGTHRKLKNAPAHAGANGRLKRHFRNSSIRLDMAASAIAYALSLTKETARSELLDSLAQNTAGVATLRRGRFVFRVEFPVYGRGLFDVSGDLLFYSTNDNGHRAYRRVRCFLRKRLNQNRKSDQERRDLILASRRQRRTVEALFRKYA